jgi:hypothetical protein
MDDLRGVHVCQETGEICEAGGPQRRVRFCEVCCAIQYLITLRTAILLTLLGRRQRGCRTHVILLRFLVCLLPFSRRFRSWVPDISNNAGSQLITMEDTQGAVACCLGLLRKVRNCVKGSEPNWLHEFKGNSKLAIRGGKCWQKRVSNGNDVSTPSAEASTQRSNRHPVR